MRAFVEFIPDLSRFRGKAILTSWGSARIAVPFNREHMKDVVSVLRKKGWVLDLKQTNLKEDTDWYPYQRFNHADTSVGLEVVYFDFMDGSVCEKRKIGEVTKTESVYEFSCK